MGGGCTYDHKVDRRRYHRPKRMGGIGERQRVEPSDLVGTGSEPADGVAAGGVGDGATDELNGGGVDGQRRHPWCWRRTDTHHAAQPAAGHHRDVGGGRGTDADSERGRASHEVHPRVIGACQHAGRVGVVDGVGAGRDAGDEKHPRSIRGCGLDQGACGGAGLHDDTPGGAAARLRDGAHNLGVGHERGVLGSPAGIGHEQHAGPGPRGGTGGAPREPVDVDAIRIVEQHPVVAGGEGQSVGAVTGRSGSSSKGAEHGVVDHHLDGGCRGAAAVADGAGQRAGGDGPTGIDQRQQDEEQADADAEDGHQRCGARRTPDLVGHRPPPNCAPPGLVRVAPRGPTPGWASESHSCPGSTRTSRQRRPKSERLYATFTSAKQRSFRCLPYGPER